MVEKFSLSGDECRQRDSQGCQITFKLEQLSGKDRYKAEVLQKRGAWAVSMVLRAVSMVL